MFSPPHQVSSMKSTSHQVDRHLAVTISKNSHHPHGKDFALNSSETPGTLSMATKGVEPLFVQTGFVTDL